MTNLFKTFNSDNLYAYIKKAILNYPYISLAFCTVLLYAVIKLILLSTISSPILRFIIFIFSCAIAIPLGTLKTGDLPQSPKFVFRGIMSLFVLYLLFATPSILITDLPILQAIELTGYRWLAPALGIISLWRTSWALPLLIAVLWQKAAISGLLGITLSQTDYMPVLEFGFMLTLGSLLLDNGQKYLNIWLSNKQKDELHVLDSVLLTAIAAHFSNYLFSGVQKLKISDPFWQWALHNPTYNLTLAALENGSSPISIFDTHIVNSLIGYQVEFNTLLNITLLILQLGAVIAITRIRWSAVATLLYDVTHIVIFIFTGIFFYKWIWLNLLITFALAKKPKTRIPNDLKAWLVGVVILAPSLFFVAFLGWFDTPSFNDEYIEAITESGDTLRAPSNYFLSSSIPVAQQRLLRYKPNHFPTNTFGSLTESDINQSSYNNSMDCIIDTGPPNVKIVELEIKIAANIIRNHHKYILDNIHKDGTINYDLYPHHIFSMPWNFTVFYNLDKRKISSYRYVVESKCLSFKDGERSMKVIRRNEFNVPVR